MTFPAPHAHGQARCALDDIALAFDGVRTLARLSRPADRGSDTLLQAIELMCDRGSAGTRAIRGALRQLPDGQSMPAPAPRHGRRADRFSDSPATMGHFTVQGRPWTLERLLRWTHAVDQRMARLPGGESYETWRADVADAGVGVDSADSWPRVRRQLTLHWDRLESDYARECWMRDWYVRLLAPRSPGWPDDDA